MYLYENDEVLCFTVYSFSYLVATAPVMSVTGSLIVDYYENNYEYTKSGGILWKPYRILNLSEKVQKE